VALLDSISRTLYFLDKGHSQLDVAVMASILQIWLHGGGVMYHLLM